jgi:hypothetical protein
VAGGEARRRCSGVLSVGGEAEPAGSSGSRRKSARLGCPTDARRMRTSATSTGTLPRTPVSSEVKTPSASRARTRPGAETRDGGRGRRARLSRARDRAGQREAAQLACLLEEFKRAGEEKGVAAHRGRCRHNGGATSRITTSFLRRGDRRPA